MRICSRKALKRAEDDALLDSLATMGLSFDGRARRVGANPCRRNSWNSGVMATALGSESALFEKVAKETGELITVMDAAELLIATYGGARGRELRMFDVRSIDAAVKHYERVDATRSDRHHGPRFSGTDHRRATAPRRRTVATPRQPVGSGAVLEAVPEGRVLVVRAPPGRYDGRGARAGAHKRWLLARAALRKSKAKTWAVARDGLCRALQGYSQLGGRRLDTVSVSPAVATSPPPRPVNHAVV